MHDTPTRPMRVWQRILMRSVCSGRAHFPPGAHYSRDFLNSGHGVVDAAGGIGELSCCLALLGVKSTVVDPKPTVGCLCASRRRALAKALGGGARPRRVQLALPCAGGAGAGAVAGAEPGPADDPASKEAATVAATVAATESAEVPSSSLAATAAVGQAAVSGVGAIGDTGGGGGVGGGGSTWPSPVPFRACQAWFGRAPGGEGGLAAANAALAKRFVKYSSGRKRVVAAASRFPGAFPERYVPAVVATEGGPDGDAFLGGGSIGAGAGGAGAGGDGSCGNISRNTTTTTTTAAATITTTSATTTTSGSSGASIGARIFEGVFEVGLGHELLRGCSMVLGLHPDEATDAVPVLASAHGKPFAVVPCCVFAELHPHRTLPTAGRRVGAAPADRGGAPSVGAAEPAPPESAAPEAERVVGTRDELVEWIRLGRFLHQDGALVTSCAGASSAGASSKGDSGKGDSGGDDEAGAAAATNRRPAVNRPRLVATLDYPGANTVVYTLPG